MSKRANPTVIGVFVLGAMILMVVAVFIFSGDQWFAKRSRYVLFFQGSVQGLNVGATVNFRGVKIGTVTDIQLLVVDPSTDKIQIPVYIDVDPKRFTRLTQQTYEERRETESIERSIAHGLRAQLDIHSLLTGQLFIELDFMPDKTVHLVGIENEVPEIPTVPTVLQEFSKTLQEFPFDKFLQKASSIATGVERFVSNPELAKSVRAFNHAAQAFSQLTQRIETQVGPVTENVNLTLIEARQRLVSLDSSIVEFNSTLEQARATFKVVEDLLADDSPLLYQFTQTLNQIRSTTRSFNELTDMLAQQPEAVFQGKKFVGEK